MYFIDPIDVGNDLYGLLNYHLFYIAVKKHSSVEHLCEVDVFKHPRFSDEFSHLVNRHSVASAKLLFKYYLDGIDVCNVLYGLLNCHHFDIGVKKLLP